MISNPFSALPPCVAKRAISPWQAHNSEFTRAVQRDHYCMGRIGPPSFVNLESARRVSGLSARRTWQRVTASVGSSHLFERRLPAFYIAPWALPRNADLSLRLPTCGEVRYDRRWNRSASVRSLEHDDTQRKSHLVDWFVLALSSTVAFGLTIKVWDLLPRRLPVHAKSRASHFSSTLKCATKRRRMKPTHYCRHGHRDAGQHRRRGLRVRRAPPPPALGRAQEDFPSRDE